MITREEELLEKYHNHCIKDSELRELYDIFVKLKIATDFLGSEFYLFKKEIKLMVEEMRREILN